MPESDKLVYMPISAFQIIPVRQGRAFLGILFNGLKELIDGVTHVDRR
jgi:hypothetical protein